MSSSPSHQFESQLPFYNLRQMTSRVNNEGVQVSRSQITKKSHSCIYILFCIYKLRPLPPQESYIQYFKSTARTHDLVFHSASRSNFTPHSWVDNFLDYSWTNFSIMSLEKGQLRKKKNQTNPKPKNHKRFFFSCFFTFDQITSTSVTRAVSSLSTELPQGHPKCYHYCKRCTLLTVSADLFILNPQDQPGPSVLHF